MLQSTAFKALFGVSAIAVTVFLFGHGAGSSWWLADAAAQPVPDIRTTKHNFTSYSDGGSHLGKTVPSRSVKSTSTTEVCVYCHTPHAVSTAPAPLWNRQLPPDGGYTMYSSMSLDQTAQANPGNYSKLCLACHDGTLAVSTVSNAPGAANTNPLATTGLTTDKIALGTGGGTEGYTRLIGTDLRNDHPIAINFNNTIAGTDGELRTDAYNETTFAGANSTAGKRIFNKRTSGSTPPHLVGFADDPLVSNSPVRVQCPTCHDPHLGTVTDANLPAINNKFLRLNRFQMGTSSKSLTGYGDATAENPFDPATDQVCLGCHTREGKAWTASAHANSLVADEKYRTTPDTPDGTTIRQFPVGTKVWNAGCLNCHDTHTKTGARRLLREGVSGANSAIENTCYQCHNTNASSVIKSAANAAAVGTTGLRIDTATTGDIQVPDIATEFGRTIRMPIANTTEVHEIRNADFEECRKTLGATSVAPPVSSNLGSKCDSVAAGTNTNRHAECTDCHNPHRVRRGAKFSTDPSDSTDDGRRRTHIAGGLEGNVISGALRGTWGVEPGYGTIDASTTWPTIPSDAGFEVKRGDPGSATSTARDSTYLTREYQLCFKCHSNYAYGSTPPALGGTNLTAASANGYNTNNTAALYTNQAGEYSAKMNEYSTNLASLTSTHQCEAGGDSTCTPIGGSWGANSTTNAGATAQAIGNAGSVNHRSWHPVHYPTGRTAAERSNSGSNGDTNFKTPFKTALGIQTMHCSDCHGAPTGTTSGGSWTPDTGPNLAEVQGPHGSANNFLLRGTWASGSDRPGNISRGQLCFNCHVGNVNKDSSGWGQTSPMGHSSSEHGKNCGYCHIAVPHGWKNKAFLVNLNCVGPEGGRAVNCARDATGTSGTLNYGPYYVGAVLRIKTWYGSRQWQEGGCGPTSGTTGKDWMTTTACQ